MRYLRSSLVGVFLFFLTVLLLAMAGYTILSAFKERTSARPSNFESQERVFTVNTLEVTPQTATPILTVFGEVQTARSVNLRATSSGSVIDISPQMVEGGRVAKGDMLLAIDPVNADAEYRVALANLKDARTSVLDAKERLALAKDELLATQLQAELQSQALVRAKDLNERGVGSGASVETAELSAANSDASVLTKRQSLANAQTGVAQSQTALERSEISLEEAQRRLDDTRLTAAFDGVVANVNVALGSEVSSNEQLGVLMDPDQLEVSFRVSTAQYARMIEGGDINGTPIEIRLDGDSKGLSAAGAIIRESASVAEGQTGRLLFASLEASPVFRAGDFVSVIVKLPELSDVAILPASAYGADGTILMLDEDNRLQMTQVSLRHRQGDEVILDAMALAGKQVVAERSPLLGQGVLVRPLRDGVAAKTQPELIKLDAARRSELIEAVNQSRMPQEAKKRLIGKLEQDEVSAELVARTEKRMGL